MAKKTDHWIIRPKPVEEIPHHDMSQFERQRDIIPLNYLDVSLIPEADLVVHVSEVKRVPADFKPYVTSHKHEVSSFYGLIGDLTVEVILDGERHEVTGPASIFIPPEVMHSIRPLSGQGYMIIILRRGNYK
jgi:hypothetical protein